MSFSWKTSLVKLSENRPLWLVGMMVLVWFVFEPDFLETIFQFFVVLSQAADGTPSGQDCSCCGNAQNGGENFNTSTPFLCVYKNGSYEIDNDLMYGKKTTFFSNFELGRRVYEEGSLVPEIYKISTNPDLIDGKIKLQLIELEPEDSYIDTVKLSKIIYPATAELVVDASFSGMYAVKRDDIINRVGVSGVSLTPQFLGNRRSTSPEISIERLSSEQQFNSLCQKNQPGIRFEDGDVLEVTAKVESLEADKLLLFVGANYRDWLLSSDATPRTARKILKRTALLSPFWSSAARVAIMIFMLFPVWVVSSLLSTSRQTANDGSEMDFMRAFGIPATSADVPSRTPKCFNVEYWDGSHFVPITFIQPRYCHSTLEAVSVPWEAVDGQGLLKLRLIATNTHNLSYISLAAPSSLMLYKSADLSLSSAHCNRAGGDSTDVLSSEKNASYVHVIPADTIELEFTEPGNFIAKEGEKESYVISVRGFYTSLSEESKVIAGDWESRLSEESANWLQEMVAMGRR